MPPAILVALAPVALFLTFWALFYWPLAGIVGVLKGVASRGSARAFGRSGPIGSYSSILVVIAVGGIAAVGAGYLFVELAEQVRLTTSAVNYDDQAIHTWVGHERQAAMTILLATATTMGGPVAGAAIVAVVAAALLVKNERALAIFLVVTAAAGALLNTGLKMIFARARPDLTAALAAAGSYSFPSGHAMASFIIFGALAYIAVRQPWSWATKSAALAIALTVVVLVGVSRVYLGVHWASDIAGAWTAGSVWLTSAVVAFEMLLRLRQRRRGRDADSAPTGEFPGD
jgi:undecaprenyl-diphosphatase